jgi:hypothetical protein
MLSLLLINRERGFLPMLIENLEIPIHSMLR